MAIKKRKKIKNKKVRVDKSSSSPPGEEKGAEPKAQEKAENTKPKEAKTEKKTPVTKENTAVKEPAPKPKSKSKEEEDGGLKGIAAYIEFLKLTRNEFRKINWPDRRQIIQETWTVLVLVTFITLLVLGYDWVLGNMVFGPLEHWIKLNL